MGDYNPHAPYIIGNEWVPILDPGLLPEKNVENGYSFSLSNAATIVTGSYFTKTLPPTLTGAVAELMAVYAFGTEDQTGPIMQLVIPCTGVQTTGSGISGVPSVSAAAVSSPSDSNYLQIAPTTSTNRIGFSFDVTTYANALDNKRILDVTLLYTAAGDPLDFGGTSVSLARAATITNGTTSGGTPVGAATILDGTELGEISFGEVNTFFSSAVVPPLSQQPHAYPWRYEELALLQPNSAAGTKLIISWFNSDITAFQFIGYAALRITYCEEKRLAYGAHRATSVSPLVEGYRYIPLRDPDFNTSITLPGGKYSVVISQVPLSDTPSPIPPVLGALEELYELPSLGGLQVNKSLTPATTFTKEYDSVIPALGLHTTAFVVTGSHEYGQQIGAPVYNGINLAQQMETSVAPLSTASYPQIRFYARRFGDTTSDLTVTLTNFAGATAVITVAEFDALPEIVNGWKEVTLRLQTAAVIGVMGVEPIVWSAKGTSSQQWQIMGARCLEPQPSTAAQQGDTTTYRAPLGDVASITWKSPNVTSSTADEYADVTFILSQDPPLVSGFGLSLAYQEVATVGLHCGVPNACIPTGISYNELTWDNQVTIDTFNRSLATGMGSTDTGETYTILGTSSRYSVTGGVGRMSWTTTGDDHSAILNVGYVDHTISVDMQLPALLTTGVMELFLFTRYVDASNTYVFYVLITAAGVVTYTIYRIVAGVSTAISGGSVAITYTAGLWLRLNATSTANTHSFTVTPMIDGEFDEPVMSTTVISTALTTGTRVGFGGYVQGGSTFPATPFYAYVDNLQANYSNLNGVTQELQRFDAYDTDWNTIMMSDDITIQSFSDYEARIGVFTQYRMRNRNMLDFMGAWVTGSGTIPTPGVQAIGDGNSVLIFTSNVGPTGNLAYTMTWDSRPIESFVFPEADTVQLQRMFGKNFMTAFRPLERGGERFQRTLLVNAAAIALPSLANFRSLRDLAWADIPYVCVRDELGNRWFATVLVPSGDVQVDRQIYLAQIEVVETNEFPYPVNPSL